MSSARPTPSAGLRSGGMLSDAVRAAITAEAEEWVKTAQPLTEREKAILRPILASRSPCPAPGTVAIDADPLVDAA